MNLTCLELFQNELTVSNINTAILMKDGSNLSMIDNGFRLHLYKNYKYDSIFDFLQRHSKPDTIVRFTDDFKFIYYVVFIPQQFLKEEESPYFIIGPFLKMRMSAEEILSILVDNNVSEQLLTDISLLYDSIPIVDNIAVFESLIINVVYRFFQREYTVIDSSNHISPLLQTFEKPQTVEENSRIAIASIEERYKVENQMLEAVAAGDYKRASIFHQKFITYYIQPRTDNLIQNTQNFLIILNTLCRKAVEQGGVHPLYIDDLSRRIAILINSTTTIRELKNIESDIIHKYCLLITNHSMKGYSLVTKDIISYVDFHYMEELNLNFFANMFNLSKTYLSNLFKKETGSTLTDFIHHVRMRKAITLLNASDLPITSIATACGYNDISYFIRVFRRTYGVSPKQYQKSILHITY